MKTLSVIFAGAVLALVGGMQAFAATIIVNDTYVAANVNSGFLFNEGFNSAINPGVSTRLTGTAAGTLSYLKRGNKNDTAYTISGNKGNISSGSQTGRHTMSADGATPFDFATVLGLANATPSSPAVYDVGIAMNNKGTTGRMSFAFGTTETGAGGWDFGIQLFKSGTNYNVYKRIRTLASGLTSELNSVITNTGSAGSEITFLIRVTDAGAETGAYSSRVQVSLDSGATWFYDTQTDTELTNGWHFAAATRYFIFDQAINDGGDTYDNFSITLIDPLIWTGGGVNNNWSTGADWLRGVGPATGSTIATGDTLLFTGTTQQANVNDLADLKLTSILFANTGFSLSGIGFILSGSITNAAGDNVVGNDVFLGANSRINPTAGTLTFNGGITSTGRNLTVSGAGTTIINGAITTDTGTLTKQNTVGTLILNGNNTFTGTTTVSQGLLLLNGSTSSTNTVISASGTLGGPGLVFGPVSVTGSLSAGDGIGILSTGPLTLNNSGTNVFQISSAFGTPGISWDLVNAGVNTIDVQAATTPFKFRLQSVGLNNFNKDSTYAWQAMSGSVQNYSANQFLVNDSTFTNDIAGGAFSIESTGSALNVRFVNNQGPSASPTNLTFGAGVPFNLPIADLLANRTSDPDGDARVLVSVTSTNASVSTNATDIIINSATTSTESIRYVVRDARNYRVGDTVRTATNYINIVVTNVPNAGVLAITSSGGNANLTFQGTPGQSYIIQRSQDLVNWFNISTNIAPGNGIVQFSEVPPTNPAFYRSRLP